MKVAIVVDWLDVLGGAERVIAEMLDIYPQADLFATADFLDDRTMLGGRPVATSFVQNLPFARRFFRHYLPLMPLAVEQWDFSGYALVLSSSHAVAKGIITSPDQIHVSYVHSPMRYAWDQQGQYLSTGLHHWPARWLLHRLRLWDQVSAHRPDVLIANSNFVARRIAKCWNTKAVVVYPPVHTQGLSLSRRSEDFYLTVTRLTPYKRVELMVDCFAALPERRLVIIGDGPECRRLKRRATANITFLGRQPDSVVHDHLQRCRAFLITAIEDFGIAPLEAQACGKPVIALDRGGAAETLRPENGMAPTALFFTDQTVDSLRGAIMRFESGPPIRPEDCRANAERYAPAHFRSRLGAVIQQALEGASHQRPPSWDVRN
ncbi:MAG: group 1 family glycosyl [Rhodospirillaceae bacterium]|nr:MAG: group 1 family glycosyl [Rhodospirillaceae bacterium]TNC97845.1 MAG: group 1 family glycosyl transferase [Stygiobacter sp.]